MHSPTDSSLERAFGDGRLTPQRREIAQRAAERPGAFTVDELASASRVADGSIGVATVYRAVSAMEASGWLERVGERDGRALFARCSASGSHHHHLICDSCGSIQATACPVDVDAQSAAGTGFTVTRHEVTLYGLCESCRVSATPDAPRGSEA